MTARKKPKRVAGSEYRRNKGLKAVLVPLQPDEHELLNLAAGTIVGRRRSVSQFVREAAVAAAHVRMAEYEREKKDREKPAQPE